MNSKRRSMMTCLMALLMAITGCGVNDTSGSYHNDHETVWIYLEVKTENGDTDYYYYLFGRMKAKLFEDISNNSIETGFFMISETLYHDDNGLIAEYADAINSGSLVFRIEEIKMIKLLNKKPEIGLGSERTDTASGDE